MLSASICQFSKAESASIKCTVSNLTTGEKTQLKSISLTWEKPFATKCVMLGLGKNEHRPCRIKGSFCNESTGGR